MSPIRVEIRRLRKLFGSKGAAPRLQAIEAFSADFPAIASLARRSCRRFASASQHSAHSYVSVALRASFDRRIGNVATEALHFNSSLVAR
jgi:hypothetical protein